MSLRRRLPAWIAIFAITLQSLWPLLAHAKPRGVPLLVPTCTIGGVTHYVEIDLGQTPLEQRSSTHHEHCKLCVFGAERSAALPAPDVAPLQIEAVSAGRVALAPIEVLSSPPHSPAQPRAPPVRS